MIRIIIYKNKEKECIGCCAIGHAGMAASGDDIVCAAVSFLVENTINSIELLAGQKVELITNEDEGLLRFLIDGSLSRDTSLLLKAMVLGMEQIASDDSYKQYLSLTYEEVERP